MNCGTRVVLLAGFAVVSAGPALAQATQTTGAPPPILRISREQLKPGKWVAHDALETNWNAAYAKANLPLSQLGMTSMSGPSEAWWLQGFASWEDMGAQDKMSNANETWRLENRKFAAEDSELLTQTSWIVLSYLPAISYRASSDLASKRYMQVQLVRVKPGRGREFFDNWREIVAAHEKARMEESWAFYSVVSGMPEGTFMYFQAHASLADIDRSGPMHSAEAYRNAVGEGGRARTREMTQLAVESSQTLHFAFNPKFSTVPKAWMEADPFWAPTPPPPAKPADKKKD